ncbi:MULTISPECIES: EF-hand domain-containing protein [unclassified Pseudodesulfovibrio]|uniref:EF-hand domain-containing protein n=1 Tax=unclassified Pseudodesulfovibrio TaxID=2661612 RepID=UPI0013E330FD|nr:MULTISPECIES: EF-hand domain-containing protein [unclassified Pseudodesulfovibrio]MCJ2165379.1 EF-hand domain-containing protein [Pseudodesulfovibrio sp. S3-i]
MSISALGGSDMSVGLAEMMQAARKSSQPSSDDIAQSIVEQDDADGDGLLSLEETPLDQDRFNKIDADGDGFISAEELSADAKQNMAAANMPPRGGGAGASSGSESSESEEEEYDTYDLNEDGVVTLDELLQAFKQGDQSLNSLFESLDSGTATATTQRLAMEAYQAQSAGE